MDSFCVTVWNDTLDKRGKWLAEAQRVPDGLLFDEPETLMRQQGWEFDRQKGSHRIWVSPGKTAVPLQPDGKRAKSYQVKQVLRIPEKEKKYPVPDTP